jgi:uroporphyrinogen-III decarboxylase
MGDPYSVGTYVDEWGCIFENIQQGVIGEVKKYLLNDISEWEKVRLPEELLSFNIEQINVWCAQTEKFVLAGCCPRPFERLQFICGSTNIYMNLTIWPSEFSKLLKRIHEFYIEKVTRWCQTNVDAIFFMDDWGSQSSLLISPVMWRKIFKPLYKDYIDIAHKYSKKAFMHSDGYIIDIFPDLIELGLDAINSQIFCMDVEKLGAFRGKITFWGEIDRQHLLVDGDKVDIRCAVEKIQDLLYANGGVIAQSEFGPGAKPENIQTVFESWNNFVFDNC